MYFEKLRLYVKTGNSWRTETGGFATFPTDMLKTSNAAETWVRHTDYEILEDINNQFVGAYIVGTDYRTNTGTLYKAEVLYQDRRFLVDLRPQQLMNIIMEVGVEPNGFINAPVCFDNENGQYNLTLFRPELLEQLKKDQDRTTQLASQGNYIKRADLEIGGMYQKVPKKPSDLNKYYIYLGEIEKDDKQIPYIVELNSKTPEDRKQLEINPFHNYSALNTSVSRKISYSFASKTMYPMELKERFGTYFINLLSEKVTNMKEFLTNEHPEFNYLELTQEQDWNSVYKHIQKLNCFLRSDLEPFGFYRFYKSDSGYSLSSDTQINYFNQLDFTEPLMNFDYYKPEHQSYELSKVIPYVNQLLLPEHKERLHQLLSDLSDLYLQLINNIKQLTEFQTLVENPAKHSVLRAVLTNLFTLPLSFYLAYKLIEY